ncbi:GIY-YIG nuclease family protein [Chryseobacterium lathyri]|uniref:GIY-YIG nuclease family protein n=1 Tax=Chryseobacterium lathyri TaxID=395933 RepID=UPI0027885F2D|nr:GIY-YIG nuclease family protein [Chryseobacterium lathyri]MDQ0064435.1 hypothetical protein [Chryseobacterium lathyri]
MSKAGCTFYNVQMAVIIQEVQIILGEGSNHTKNRLPVKLIYYEEYECIDLAFYREKQVQGWSRKKKEALINRCPELLPQLAVAYRDLLSEERDG